MKSNPRDLELKRLGGNIVRTIIRQGLAIIFGLGISIILARLLGPSGNGQYGMGILLPTMLANFLNFGIGPANIYFIASEKIKVSSAFKTNLGLWLFLCVIGVLISVLVIKTRSNAWFPGVPLSILWLGILAFPISLLQIFLSSLFQGLQDFRSYNYVLLISPGVTFLLALFLVGKLELGIIGALLSYIIGNLCGLITTLVRLKPFIQKNNEIHESEILKNYTRECLGYGLKAHLNNILSFVNYRVDLYLVNFFLSPASAGLYFIAIQIAERVWVLSDAVSTVLLPRLSELNNEEEKRQELTPLIARWVLLSSTAGTLILALLASPLINLLYGSKFAPTVGVLLWLLPGVVMGSASKVLANDIASRGRLELNLYTSIIVVFINIIANIILIPRYGMEGGAMATTIAYGSNTITKLYFYSRLSKNPWWKSIVINSNDMLLFQRGFNTIKRSILK
jgi:O-antigen/teichoic acid export membrane protein